MQDAGPSQTEAFKAYKLATPSLTHALEAAARYKTAMWVNFESRTVFPLIRERSDHGKTKQPSGSKVTPAEHRNSQHEEAKAKHKSFSALAIV